MFRRYFSGIHPATRKKLTQRKPLGTLEKPPEQVTLPLDMCVGAVAIPTVTVGETVAIGQIIARPADGDGVPIHASVSGRVQSIASHIVIVNDNKNTMIPKVDIDLDGISQEDLIRVICDFGITEMSGAPTATHYKITEARGRVDTLIINGTESEPYLTATYRLLMERGQNILTGAMVLARVLGVNHTILAVTGDKLKAVEQLERIIGRRTAPSVLKKNLRLRTLPNRYPLWGEKQIINAVTGREVPPDKKAEDVHCAVFSVATVCAIGESITTGRPATNRSLTVGGGGVKRPRNLVVPLGTSIQCLLENCAGLKEAECTQLQGGLMMAVPIQSLEQPILRNTEGILMLTSGEMPREYSEEACLQCGYCIEVCPMYLTPIFVRRAIEIKDIVRLASLHPQDCIGCSSCSAVCPSHIPLVQIMERGSQRIQAERSGTWA